VFLDGLLQSPTAARAVLTGVSNPPVASSTMRPQALARLNGRHKLNPGTNGY
jgi:hypothetical protein